MASYVSSAKNYIANSLTYLGNKLHNQDRTIGYFNMYKEQKDITRSMEEHVKTLSLKTFNRLCEVSKRNYKSTSEHLRFKKHMLLLDSTGKDTSLTLLPCSFIFNILQPSSRSKIVAISAIALCFQQMLKNLSMKWEIIKLSRNIKEQKILLARQALLGCNIEINTLEKQIINVIDSNIKKHKIAKITTISCLALSIVAATIGSLSVMISASLLGVGLVSAIATRYFSNKIESDYQKISKAQKERNIDCNYQLSSNKLFYMQMKASN